MQDNTRPPIHGEFRRRFPVARPSRVSTVETVILERFVDPFSDDLTKDRSRETISRGLTGGDIVRSCRLSKKKQETFKIKIHIRDLRRSVKDKHHLSLNKLRSARCAANNNTDGAEVVCLVGTGLIARKGQSWKGYHHRSVRLFNRNVVSMQKKKT